MRRERRGEEEEKTAIQELNQGNQEWNADYGKNWRMEK